MIGEHVWVSPAPSVRERVATPARWLAHDHPHIAPLLVLWTLTAIVMRRWVFSGALPAGEDSAFLYSSLPYFASHHLGMFNAWLPSPLGQVQQYSIYWFLAMWGGIVRNPLTLYKGACFAVALLTPAAMYAASYSLLRSRLSSAVAAGLYAFSPLVISHWLAGHLNVEISFAVGPLAVWALHLALRNRSIAAMIGFGLSISALYLLTTAQGVYWGVPLAAITAFEWVTWVKAGGTHRAFAARLAMVGGVSLLAFIAASAVELVPLMRGGAAPFVGGGESYYIEQLSIHQKYSLPFIQGVAGMPREDWLDTNVNFAAGGFASIWFIASAFFVVVTAASTLWSRHRRLAIAFLVPTVFAWLLAAGPTGPFRAAYLFLYDHVGYFRLIRVPNRWLIVSVFGIALLAGASVQARIQRERGQERSWLERLRGPSVLRRVGALSVAGLVVSSYAFANGLPTWSPPAGYVNAYSSLAEQPGDWRILTTPFYQAWMSTGSPYGDDVSLAADLGFTSTIWHVHATLGRGGWDPRASRLVSYLYELTKQGANRSVSKLLGAMGIRYVALDPHGALEVIQGQNHFFREQTGLSLSEQSQGVEVYRNASYLPQAYVTPQWCVVAGGLGVLGDLAEDPSFDFGRVGIEFADQLRATQGIGALRSAVASSGCVIAAPNGLASLRALLGATALTDTTAIAAPAWTREDVSPSLDDAAEATPMVDVPPGGHVTQTVSVPAAGTYSVWLRGPVGPDQATPAISVDGNAIAATSLASPLAHGVRWTPSAPVQLAAGTHTMSVANAAVAGGATLQLVQTALMSRGAAEWRPSSSVRTIREDVPGSGSDERLDPARPLIDSWRATYGLHAQVSIDGANAAVSDLGDGRRYYTLFRAHLARPIEPSRTLGMDFTGTGSGQSFYLNVLFGRGGYQRMSFRFRDTTTAQRLLLFSPLHPSSVTRVPDWSKVTELTVSTNSKRGWTGAMSLAGPFLTTASRGSRTETGPTFSQVGHAGDPFANATPGVHALKPADQLIGDGAMLAQDAGPGLLTFTQSYNPTWTLHSGGGDVSPSIGLGFGNAYPLSGRTRPESISLGLARYGRIGTAVSLVAWTLMLLAMALLYLRRRRKSEPRV
ncbi:MAG: hypothetical protein ACJ76P_01120 [Actinomycetota bacterium]